MGDADLRRVGLKVTNPRLKILEVLETSEGNHMSAEDVYKALLSTSEDIGLATVYRVLTQFETAELVTRHNFEGGYSVFELNKGEHHDHLVCVECGNVEEFVDSIIEDQQEKIAKDAGYIITNHSLNIYGVCKKCQ